MTRFTKLAAVTVAMTFLLVVVGVVVRSTGSGLGCPEWPTCHGSWVPPFDNPHAIIEWSHRTTAAIVGILALATGIAAVVGYRRRHEILWPALAALGLVVFQAALGKAAVESDLSGDIVTAHLATAMALLALLLFVALRSSLPTERRRTGSEKGSEAAGTAPGCRAPWPTRMSSTTTWPSWSRDSAGFGSSWLPTGPCTSTSITARPTTASCCWMRSSAGTRSSTN